MLPLASIITEGVAGLLRQRPRMDRTSEADPIAINFEELEPQLSDEVNIARIAALSSDQAKRG